MAAETKRTITIYINGKEVENSIKGVSTAMTKAQAEIKKMTIGTEEYENKAKEIAQLKSIISQHYAGLKELEKGWTAATTKTSLFSQMLTSAKTKMIEWGGAVAAAFSTYQIFNFFKTGIESALKMCDAETLLLHAVNGRYDIQQKLLVQADALSKTTTYKRSEIIEAQEFLGLQQRSETQIGKTMQAAAELSAVTGGSLLESVKVLDATMEGKLGKGLPKLDDAFKNMTTSQLENGDAIDLVIEKYGGLATAITQTTEGKIIMAQKSWEAFKRTLGEFFLSIADKLVPVLTSGINKLKDFGTWLKNNATVVMEVGKAIGSVTVSLLTYIITTKSLNILTTAGSIIQKTFSGVIKLVRGEIELTTIAQKSFNTATKLNPIGLVLGVVAAAVTAYTLYKNKISETLEIENKLKEVRSEMSKKLGEESAAMTIIFDKLKKTNAGTTERKSLIEEINPILKDYNINLLNESSSLIDIKNAQEQANAALYKGIILDTQKSKIATLEGTRLENQLKLNEAIEQENKLMAAKYTVSLGKNAPGYKEALETIGGDVGSYINFMGQVSRAKKTAQDEINNVIAQEGKLNTFFEQELAKYKITTYKIETDLKDMSLEELKAEQERLENLGDDQGKANITRLATVKSYIAAKEKLISKDADTEEKAYDKVIEKSKAQEDELALYIAKVKDEILTDASDANAKELKEIEDKYLTEIYQLKKYQTENAAIIEEGKKQLALLKGKENTEEYKTLETHIASIISLNTTAAATEVSITEAKDNAIAAAVAKHTASQLEKQKEHLALVASINSGAIDDELTNIQDKYTKEVKELTEGYNLNKSYYNKSIADYQDYLKALDNIEKQYNASKKYLLKMREQNDYYADELVKVKGNTTKEYQIKREQLQAEADLIDENAAGIDQKLIQRKKELNRELISLDKDYLKYKRDQEIQIAQTISSALFEISSNLSQKKLNRTIAQLEKQKDNELKNIRLTEDQKTAIEKKYADQEAKIKYETAVKDWEMSMLKAAVEGALAVIKAYADSGPWGAAAAGIAVAAEIAVIASNKPVPEYYEGGYTDGDKLYRAGEKGKKEYIAPGYQVEDPVTGPIIADLNRLRTGKRPLYISQRPAEPDWNAMQTVSAAYTSFGRNNANSSNNFTSNANKYAADAKSININANEFNEFRKEFSEYKNYMKDPKNRRAMLVRDELTKFDGETDILKSLSRI